MKLLATLISLVLAISVLAEEELVGWERMLAAGNQGQSKLESPPRIEVTKIEGELIEIKVTNLANEALAYAGHSPVSTQLFIKSKIRGKWVPGAWSWCGSGVDVYSVAPGESITLKISKKHLDSQVFTLFHTRSGSTLVRLYAPKRQQGGTDRPATSTGSKTEVDGKPEQEGQARSR